MMTYEHYKEMGRIRQQRWVAKMKREKGYTSWTVFAPKAVINQLKELYKQLKSDQ